MRKITFGKVEFEVPGDSKCAYSKASMQLTRRVRVGVRIWEAST